MARRTDCGKCLRSFECDRTITEDQQKRGICSKCWAEEQDRRKQQDDQRTKTGGLSSPAAYEAAEIHSPGHTPVDVLVRVPGVIGCRRDARWYKKAGSNGDG